MVCSTSLLAPLDSLLLSLTLTSLIGQNFFFGSFPRLFYFTLDFFFLSRLFFFWRWKPWRVERKGGNCLLIAVAETVGPGFPCFTCCLSLRVRRITVLLGRDQGGQKAGSCMEVPQGKMFPEKPEGIGLESLGFPELISCHLLSCPLTSLILCAAK